jgi:hypothetical protein
MLNLPIAITSHSIEAIKLYLWNELKWVKSSHRLEAVARGLDFGTYASMLHCARSSSHEAKLTDGEQFVSYLCEHGFDVEAIHLYRAVARAAVSSVLAKVPRLSIRGYGVGEPQWDFDKKCRQTPGEQHQEFMIARDELLSKDGLDEFLLAFALVRDIPATKTIRSNAGSYRLKHIAERVPYVCSDGTVLGPRYVSNGALIAAALHAGFKMKTYIDQIGCDYINVSFNMSKLVVDDLDFEMRPDGAIAAHRAWLIERRKYRGYYGMRG